MTSRFSEKAALVHCARITYPTHATKMSKTAIEQGDGPGRRLTLRSL